MKITVVYTHVAGRADTNAPDSNQYAGYHERFAKTYAQFKGPVPHDLVVVVCGGVLEPPGCYPAKEVLSYAGAGWDIGAYQFAADRLLDCDLAVWCNAGVHFWREDWLKILVERAWPRFGANALYGFSASYEISPHLRTPCFACSPLLLCRYPLRVDTRWKTFEAEASRNSITQWARAQYWPTVCLTPDEDLALQDWRSRPNVFRRGDQSNCLVWDRHMQMYRDADAATKAELARRADDISSLIP